MEKIISNMSPVPGERLLRFVGDRVRFEIKIPGPKGTSRKYRARLRTNLGRAEVLRHEIIQAHTKGAPIAGASWRDLPMHQDGDGWSLELPLPEVGFFRAKAYLLDENNWQHWPEGGDVGISVHPDAYRTANTIYCAFPRLFGASRTAVSTLNERLESQIQQIEQHGYTIIPPSGKLRDLIAALPHVMDGLGCRILHLLPVNPTPTTYARFGRFGSPYAAQDLTAIDPALVVFDKRTTGVDQFREFTYATHLRGGRVLIDIVINHTGWGSTLQENHPEWFLRHDGEFASPGAWGVTWEDLVELKHDNVALWDQLAEMFLVWCRRGVDGFRCDAGYKVPVAAWQYIIARVQQEFPETIFLLEGLGGSWEATESLLTEGGMQWAYSELFQNYSGRDIAWYLDYALRQSECVGVYVHYSETHDNDRLAKRGRAWSLLRNRLCALASVNGGFGFTCGVEWLATEKIRVHGSTGLSWGQQDNIVPELAQLNRLLTEHPCFFDNAKLTRLSPPDSPVFALLRESAEGKDSVLVLVNTDVEKPGAVSIPQSTISNPQSASDLLGQPLPNVSVEGDKATISLAPGAAFCLSPTRQPTGLSSDAYRRTHAQAAWAIQALHEVFSVAEIGDYDWRTLAEIVARSPFDFLAALPHIDSQLVQTDLCAALEKALAEKRYSRVIRWSPDDARRVTLVPANHWLLIEDAAPFRAALQLGHAEGVTAKPRVTQVQSIAVGDTHVACLPPLEVRDSSVEATLSLERYTEKDARIEAAIRFLAPAPNSSRATHQLPRPDDLVLLTNGRGGMARMCVDLGRIKSKYDCVLGANLHPSIPVDRHVFAKRIRVWVNADGFISALDYQNLVSFQPGTAPIWNFVANAGDGRTVEIELRAEMLAGRNTTMFGFRRPTAAQASGKQLPADADVRLTVRVDVEDRSFHSETKHDGGADYHFSIHTHVLEKQPGFYFMPAADRQLRVFSDCGAYHPQVEWSENIPHPVEQSRGQPGSGDAYSPGWFELPLAKGGTANLIVTAEREELPVESLQLESGPSADDFGQQLRRAANAFVVTRGNGKTVVAGYPWFLDWGRDTFICARGLLSAGMVDEVKQILITFARFEKDGTLPNVIYGDDASNRDTSDAPLWFALVCEELSRTNHDAARGIYETAVDDKRRTIREVLGSIATNYIRGTPNGIRMDPESALIWSPSHFTWMDTNYPAGTPREGYPVEIQALWIRLLQQLQSISSGSEQKKWNDLATRALASIDKLFWLEQQGWYADVLLAKSGIGASAAIPSDALRPNCLFLVSLGLISGVRAQRCVAAAQRYLVVPGALRTLAPLPLSTPLPVYGNNGGLLNDPHRPYWPRYEGDEDTRRKPAYHNGTAWTWPFPVFCEALARAWNDSPDATAAARAYLGSMAKLMNEGCLGQLPEIVDGDAPHTQRGCDAQAWGATEALRVWKLLADK